MWPIFSRKSNQIKKKTHTQRDKSRKPTFCFVVCRRARRTLSNSETSGLYVYNYILIPVQDYIIRSVSKRKKKKNQNY